jgi:CheY-like chemotaxis protein
MNQPHALVIDDNPKNVNVLARLLSEQEVTSTQITNPKLLDAALADVDTLDVIFVDLEMPGLNGFDVGETEGGCSLPAGADCRLYSSRQRN